MVDRFGYSRRTVGPNTIRGILDNYIREGAIDDASFGAIMTLRKIPLRSLNEALRTFLSDRARLSERAYATVGQALTAVERAMDKEGRWPARFS